MYKTIQKVADAEGDPTTRLMKPVKRK